MVVRIGPLIDLLHQNRGNPSFTASPAAGADGVERDARLHRQGSHIGGGEAMFKLRDREHEVDLRRLQLVVQGKRRDEIVEIQGVGAVDEEGIR